MQVRKPLQLIGVIFICILKMQAQTITDIDGNTYNAINIGTQTWMKENLQTTHFNNGDLIPTTLQPVNNIPASVYQWYYADDSLNNFDCGRLYTWYAVSDARNVCPAGWHVPDEMEWLALATFLGGDSVAGGKMKETGTVHWGATDTNVTNSSLFTGIGGGFRGNPSGYANKYSIGIFWSSTAWGSGSFQRAYTFKLQDSLLSLDQAVAVANCGMSVRCIKNNTSGMEDYFQRDEIHIFPNPVISQLNIFTDTKEGLNISIYTITGNLVLQHFSNSNSSVINISFLSQGIYLVKIISGEIVAEKKLIKY
jgi:uncharacterized protein (TIGR02145 family)